MSSTAAASGFVLLLLSVQVIQSQDGWGVTYTSTKVCAVKGSTVEIHCTYKYPSRIQHRDINTFWFTKEKDGEPVDLRTDSEYSDRMQYRCHEKRCTLMIRDLRESDAAEYKFRFMTNQLKDKYTGSPGVTLSVTDPGLQVEVSRSDSTWSELKCLSSSVLPDHPSYIWYKNGQKISEGASYSSYPVSVGDPNRYSCAVRGHEDHCSPSVYAPKLSSVSVSPSAEIVEGSSVNLTCSSDANPAAKYIWTKKIGKISRSLLNEEPQLVFRSIQSSDSGQYYCTAKNHLGRKTSEFISIDVKYAPKLPSVSVSPSAEIVEGSSVTLTCSSDANPAANYTWYKEDEDSPKASGQIFIITDFRAEHSGNYYCEAHNTRGRNNSTFHRFTVPGSMTAVAVGSTTAIFLVIIILAAFLLIRRKRSSNQTSEPGERPDNNAQSAPAEQQEGLCYASVNFSRNQEDLLYSNIRPARSHRRKEEEEDVEYSSVHFKSASAANESRCQEAVDDSSPLYSTISQHPRV